MVRYRMDIVTPEIKKLRTKILRHGRVREGAYVACKCKNCERARAAICDIRLEISRKK